MGVFDDAIREHLDLKRQHGAPEAELERQEDEAFGRHQRAGESTGQLAEAAAPEAAPVESAAPEAPVEAAEDAPPSAPETEVAEEAVTDGEDLFVVEEPAPSDEVEAPEFLDNLEPHEERGEDGEVEDVLEDTPEFLQESPEHDKMWFEQKPPKDFDFDE